MKCELETRPQVLLTSEPLLTATMLAEGNGDKRTSKRLCRLLRNVVNAMVVSQSNSRFDFFPPCPPPPSFKSCSQFYSKIRGLFKNNFHLQRRQEGTKLAKIFVAFFVLLLRDGKTWERIK